MTARSPAPPTPPRGRGRGVAGALLGAVVGFALGAAAYLLLAPVLEERTDWLRELQGLAWNLVPLGAVAGAAIGAVLGARRRR